jgi:hypothetical protein
MQPVVVSHLDRDMALRVVVAVIVASDHTDTHLVLSSRVTEGTRLFLDRRTDRDFIMVEGVGGTGRAVFRIAVSAVHGIENLEGVDRLEAHIAGRGVRVLFAQDSVSIQYVVVSEHTRTPTYLAGRHDFYSLSQTSYNSPSGVTKSKGVGLKEVKEWWRWKGGSGVERERGKKSKAADGVKATIRANGRVV